MQAVGRCMICGAQCMANPHWLCPRCLEDYPELRGSVSGWPEWARQLKRDHQQWRRTMRRDLARQDNYGLTGFDGDSLYPSERGNNAVAAAWSALDEWGYRDYNDVYDD